MKKRILSLLCCVLLLSVLPLTAAAHDAPDYNREGAISIDLSYKGKPVSGGVFSIYRVADVAEDKGNFFFRCVEELEDYDFDLKNLSSAQLASDMEEAVKETDISVTMDTVDETGNVTFRKLPIGLYLVVQGKASTGYNAVEPFLVAVPNMKNGTYVYEVNASPKVELEPAPTTKPTDPTSGTTVPGKLPQTGQNNWPVPVMLVAGMLFVFTGCWLHISGKGRKHEE